MRCYFWVYALNALLVCCLYDSKGKYGAYQNQLQ